jgi:hypothetical protein
LGGEFADVAIICEPLHSRLPPGIAAIAPVEQLVLVAIEKPRAWASSRCMALRPEPAPSRRRWIIESSLSVMPPGVTFRIEHLLVGFHDKCPPRLRLMTARPDTFHDLVKTLKSCWAVEPEMTDGHATRGDFGDDLHRARVGIDHNPPPILWPPARVRRR